MTGLFSSPPFPTFRISPIGIAALKNSGKKTFITTLHGSTIRSINGLISPCSMLQLIMPSPQSAWQAEEPGCPDYILTTGIFSASSRRAQTTSQSVWPLGSRGAWKYLLLDLKYSGGFWQTPYPTIYTHMPSIFYITFSLTWHLFHLMVAAHPESLSETSLTLSHSKHHYLLKKKSQYFLTYFKFWHQVPTTKSIVLVTPFFDCYLCSISSQLLHTWQSKHNVKLKLWLHHYSLLRLSVSFHRQRLRTHVPSGIFLSRSSLLLPSTTSSYNMQFDISINSSVLCTTSNGASPTNLVYLYSSIFFFLIGSFQSPLEPVCD